MDMKTDSIFSIFLPKGYKKTSENALPTVFTMHGGGHCVGDPAEDDGLNRSFANMHNILVVALSYRKSPRFPFPAAIHDIEALILAICTDESLPIDKSRIAVGGFSAGAALSLSVCQLPSIREKVKPAAVFPIYPAVDWTLTAEDRAKSRYYKQSLTGLRSGSSDMLAPLMSMFLWNYVPTGQDLRDPLLSPAFAARENLPPHIFMVAAELDHLARESWLMACRLSGRPTPALGNRVGQEHPGEPNKLILDDERFAFEQLDANGGSLRWLLVPDQVHSFDHHSPTIHGSKESAEDAEAKTRLYQQALGDWLREVAWKSQPQ